MHFAKPSKASRRDFLFKSSLSGLGLGLMSNKLFGYSSEKMNDLEINAPVTGALTITDLRCAIIGGSPVIRITTNEGISGYGQAESTKP